MRSAAEQVDAVVVGAGFSGLYMLYRLREQGLRTVVLEAAESVGGTWYWNRYPGARCDTESMAYSYSFSEALEQQWEWAERYPGQPEILAYIEHVTQRFQLSDHIRFSTRVARATYLSSERQWRIETDRGEELVSQFCIMATGCLSVPQQPDIPGLETFAGEIYHTALWPTEPVDFHGKRVAVIGTGSSGIQAIPLIAEQAEHLTVFQRTANFSVPANNQELDRAWMQSFKSRYREHRADLRSGKVAGFGDLLLPDGERGTSFPSATGMARKERDRLYERYWQLGGTRFLRIFDDTLTDHEANRLAADFVRGKIREIVSDPDTAAMLCPSTYPIGTKRICVDTNYYATFNRPNVALVDLTSDPIQHIEPHGVLTTAGDHRVDALVLATGFDAMTGALLEMDIQGESGLRLESKWKAGPRTYLGISVAGFPNLFLVTGPGSPSVLSNMLVSIEQHVDWISDCIAHMRESGYHSVVADVDAEDEWVAHVDAVAHGTLYPEAGSWYMGANVPSKPRVFMPYAGGVGPYRDICDEVVASGYKGFTFF